MTDKIYKAIQYAVTHYKDAGVGADGSYFLPSMEMLSILNSMNMGETRPDLMIAGVLYHTVEETETSIDRITEQFGNAAADLLRTHMQYLNLGWEEGSQRMIAEFKDTHEGFQILTLCDIVVRLRELVRELRITGEEAWRKQVTSKEKLCSYFIRLQDELYDMQFDEMLALTYWEMTELYKDIFIAFYLDLENRRLFQISIGGEGYMINPEKMQWDAWTEGIPEGAVRVNRKYAERIEDEWGEAYNLEQQAIGYRFEEYVTSLNSHLRDFLREVSEHDRNNQVEKNA